MEDLNPVPSTEAKPAETAEPAKSKVSADVRFYRQAIFAPLVKGGQLVPNVEQRLVFGCWKGNPRVIVESRDPDIVPAKENNFGRQEAQMGLDIFQQMVDGVQRLIAGNAPGVLSWEHSNKYNKYTGDRYDTPQLINTTVIGREEDGRIFIGLKEGAMPFTKFYFGKSIWTKQCSSPGQEIAAGQASQNAAIALLTAVNDLMKINTALQVAFGESEDDEPRVKTGGQGGYQNRGGGGGGYQNRQGGGGYQNRGGGGGGYQNRQGGGGGGGYQNRGGGGGYQNRGGGGGYQGGNRQGGGGYQGGGGGGQKWNNYSNGGGQGGGQGGGAPATAGGGGGISNDDLNL